MISAESFASGGDRSASAPSSGPDVLSWHATMGTHYRLMPDAWMGTVRSFPTPSKLSFFPDVTDLKPEGLSPVVGRFSGDKRYYDFDGVLGRDKIGHDYGRFLDEAVAARTDLIWNVGQIHGSHAKHVAFIMEDQGAHYKDLMYQAVKYTSTGRFAAKPVDIYWEVGNEINSWRRFGLRDLGEQVSNADHARDYLEYFLAPAVEAIRAASADFCGDPRRVKILLGNITFVRHRDTPKFFDAILNGVVEGEHAPTLKGKHGYELIDAIGLHYTHGDAKLMASYYDRWVGSGKVAGMWNTEELGHAGLGDFDIARLSFRWLDFWARRSWTRDTARMQFWGDQAPTNRERSDGLSAETTGENMQRHLGNFLRDYPLSALDAGRDFSVISSGSHESYAFIARRDLDKRRFAILVLPAGEEARIEGVTLKGATGKVLSAKAFVQPVETVMRPVNVTAIPTADGLRLDLGALKLKSTESLLLEVDLGESSGSMKVGTNYRRRPGQEEADLALLKHEGFDGLRLSRPPVTMRQREAHFRDLVNILRTLPDTVDRSMQTLDLRPFTVPGAMDGKFHPDWYAKDQYGELILQQGFRGFTLNSSELKAEWADYIDGFSAAVEQTFPAAGIAPLVGVNNELHMSPRATILRVALDKAQFNEDFAKLHHGYKRLTPFQKPDLGLAANFATGFHLADYSDDTQEVFRGWLIDRHGGLDAANAALGTGFKQRSDIHAPVPEAERSPLWWEWLDFRYDNFRDYFSGIRRELSGRLPLTHNFVATRYTLADPYSAVDPWEIGRELDAMGVDYPDLFDFHVLAPAGRRVIVPEASVGYVSAYMYREALLAAAGGSYLSCFWHTNIDFIEERAEQWKGVRQAQPFIERMGGKLHLGAVSVIYLRDTAYTSIDHPLEVDEEPQMEEPDNELAAATRLVSGGDKSFIAADYLGRVTGAWALLMGAGYQPGVVSEKLAGGVLVLPEARAVSDRVREQIESHDGLIVASGPTWGSRDGFQRIRLMDTLPDRFQVERVGYGRDAVLQDGTVIPGACAWLKPLPGGEVVLRDREGRALAVASKNSLYLGFSLPSAPFAVVDGLQRERLEIDQLNTAFARTVSGLVTDFLTSREIVPEARITGEVTNGVWSTLLDDGDRWHLVLIDYADWVRTWETMLNPEFCEPIDGLTQPRCYRVTHPDGDAVFRPKAKSFQLNFRLPGTIDPASFQSVTDRDGRLVEVKPQLDKVSPKEWSVRIEGMEFIQVLTFSKTSAP